MINNEEKINKHRSFFQVSAEELKMPRPVGVLVVKVLEARNLINADKFGNIDPYVILSQGVKEKKTGIASGQNPIWNTELIEFAMEVPETEELHLMIFDKV